MGSRDDNGTRINEGGLPWGMAIRIAELCRRLDITLETFWISRESQ